jgi:hypothetical protein
MIVSIEWLKKLNTEFRDAGIDQRKRPWEALRRYSKEYKQSIELSSDIANEIFDWFKTQSKPGIHEVGSLFETVYFFDATFWPVSVPLIYGTVQLNAFDCLYDMPEAIKSDLSSTPNTAWDYTIYWADCIDYGLGMDDLRKASNLDAFGMDLLAAADQELKAAISQLKEKRPDSRSILSSRMATELFIKSFIALKAGLTPKDPPVSG